MEGEDASIHFNCFVHYPSFTEEGLEVESVARGNGIQLHPSTQISSLAASVLSEMFQKQEIDGKVIMKADNAKGQWRGFFSSKELKFCIALTFNRFSDLVFVFAFNLQVNCWQSRIYMIRALAMSNCKKVVILGM